MRESRLIFENLKIKKKSYNLFNCFKESTITNDINIFFHFEFVSGFNSFKIFTSIEFIFLRFSFIHDLYFNLRDEFNSF